MKTFTKIRWAASILLVFFIVLITNLIDRDNFKRLSYSVTTIYEDRIVASDLLFEMAMVINEKQIAIVSNDSLGFQKNNEKANRDLIDLIERYEQTKLTENEQFVFNRLKDELSNLKRLEQSYFRSDHIDDINLIQSTEKITQHLYDLSKIQLKEGRRQVSLSDKAMDTIDLLTQGEIVFLVLMAILIQIIILYKPKDA